MKIHTYTGGCVQTNGYLLQAPDGWLAIDAPADISKFAQSHDIEVTHGLLTHQHFDHVEDASTLPHLHAFSKYDPDLIMDQRAKDWGLPVNVPEFSVETILKDCPTLELAGLTFQLLHVPGHSPDSVAFHLPEEKLLFGGDALFSGGTGRTDLPGGNHEELLKSIREKLFTLPDDTMVYSGHGPSTTIGKEKASNPFVRI